MALVKTLDGTQIVTQLELAYKALAHALLKHRRSGQDAILQDDIASLDAAICGTEEPVDLAAARVECNLIDCDAERPVEIYNNLNHMFVIRNAAILLAKQGCLATYCAPSQQSQVNGSRIADLQGDEWALEAYGGFTVGNNGKLAKDLRTLGSYQSLFKSVFLAMRMSALTSLSSEDIGRPRPIRARCSKSHGGPFTTTARIELIGIEATVAVLKVNEINVLAE